MATTTNYGWTTPDDTALVKDGAAAIRTLGTSIDTTVFNNASAAIAKTIVDAKGDIIAATASDTVSRLAVGANDTVLTADSTAATGLKWATAAGGGMTLLSTTALSGTATTITGISQAYTDLIIYIPAFTYNANADFSFKTGDTSLSANYYFLRQRTTVQSFSAAAARVNSDMSGTAPQGIYITINRYSDAARHGGYALVMNANVGDVAFMNWYDYSTLTGISQIQISSVAGTSTMSAGNVYIYGVK
jgi:hypothetical protein